MGIDYGSVFGAIVLNLIMLTEFVPNSTIHRRCSFSKKMTIMMPISFFKLQANFLKKHQKSALSTNEISGIRIKSLALKFTIFELGRSYFVWFKIYIAYLLKSFTVHGEKNLEYFQKDIKDISFTKSMNRIFPRCHFSWTHIR